MSCVRFGTARARHSRGAPCARQLSVMADVLRAHWGATPSPPVFAGGDMVVWNALLRASPSSPHPQPSRVRLRCARGAEDERRVYTGYPFGAVSLPMYGMLASAHREPTGRYHCVRRPTARPALTPLPDPTYRPRCSLPPLPRRNAHAATPGSTRRADSTGSRTRCRYRGRRSPHRDIDAATRPAAHRSRRPNAPRSWRRRPGLYSLYVRALSPLLPLDPHSLPPCEVLLPP